MGLTELSFLERMEEMGFMVNSPSSQLYIKKRKNIDMVRSLTDIELAEFLANLEFNWLQLYSVKPDPSVVNERINFWFIWLNQEHKEEQK